MFLLPQCYWNCEQDPQQLVQGARFALKLIVFVAAPLLVVGLLFLLSQVIVVLLFNGTELF